MFAQVLSIILYKLLLLQFKTVNINIEYVILQQKQGNGKPTAGRQNSNNVMSYKHELLKKVYVFSLFVKSYGHIILPA